MVRIVSGLHSDEDCRALQSVPPGWTVMRIQLGWVAYRTWEVWGDEFAPVGPFKTADLAVSAADSADRRTRTEPEGMG